MRQDSKFAFTSPNGLKSSAATEWELVACPVPDKEYPERDGLILSKPEWCRAPLPLADLKARMKEQNKKLQASCTDAIARLVLLR